MPIKLHVIEGTPHPDPAKEARSKRLRAEKPAYVVQCHRCGCREVIETKTGVMLKNGRPTGGTKQLICAGCHRKGERVVLA